VSERDSVDQGHASVIQDLYRGLWAGYVQAAGNPQKETAAITHFREGLAMARRCYTAATKALAP
jgi:hypothetical protein